MAFGSAAGAHESQRFGFRAAVRALMAERLVFLPAYYCLVGFFSLGSFFFSWMNHLFHMGCEGKPFLPKFVSFFSKLRLALITMVTCMSAPCQGAPVNSNQLRTGNYSCFYWLIKISLLISSSQVLFSHWLLFLFILMNSWVLHWAVLIPNAPETARPINQRSRPTHFPLTTELIQNTLIIRVPLFREQHR